MTKQNPRLQKVWIWLQPGELKILNEYKIVSSRRTFTIFKRKPINEKIVLRKETEKQP